MLKAIIDIGAAVVGLVADAGISSLIGNVAATNVTKSNCKIFDKLMIGVGTAVVAGMAGEAAQNYIQKKADAAKEAIDRFNYETPESEEKEEENGGEISE